MNSIDYSAFQSSSFSLDQKLEKARAELLDLGGLEIACSISPDQIIPVFLMLLMNAQIKSISYLFKIKVFTFLHGKASKGEEDEFDDELNDEKRIHLSFR